MSLILYPFPLFLVGENPPGNLSWVNGMVAKTSGGGMERLRAPVEGTEGSNMVGMGN
jgi:hypothetical protein